MRWLQSAWTFVLAIVLALAFVSMPVAAVDVQNDMTFTTQIVDLSPELVNLPARAFDVGTMDAVMIASYVASDYVASIRVASARFSRIVVDKQPLEDLLMFESAYHRNVAYHSRT